MSEQHEKSSNQLQVNPPDLEAMMKLFPWKPTRVLSRCVEWREIYRNRELLSMPILDLGCGTCEISRLMYGDQRVAGIDIDVLALRKALRDALSDVVHGDARRLPFRDGSFNSIASICVMEHLPEIDLCLEEITRVLRPGGVLVATVPSKEWKSLFFWNHFFSAIGLKKLGRRLADAYDCKLIHLNIFGKKIWEEKLRKVGLKLERIDPWLNRPSTRFVSLVESVSVLPFPFPGFWTDYGTYFFIVGVLKRLGDKQVWNHRLVKYITPMFLQKCPEGEIAGGYMLVFRKLEEE